MEQADPHKTINPYISARRKWDIHVGDAVAGRVTWQFVALISLALLLTREAYHAHQAVQPKMLPYVVEVDKLGNTQAVMVAEQLKTADTRMIESELREWVTLARRVTTDVALQTAAIHGVFAMLTPKDPAHGKYLQEFGRQTERFPFERAKSETVKTEVVSVLQQTEETWEVEWVETVFDKHGETTDRALMRALLQVYQAPEELTDEEALRLNPLGIYVRDYNWGRKERQEVHE